jgi:hypothetical protein
MKSLSLKWKPSAAVCVGFMVLLVAVTLSACKDDRPSRHTGEGLTLQIAVENAKSVYVSRDQGKLLEGIAVMNNMETPVMLRLFRQSSGFGRDAPKSKPDLYFQIKITSPGPWYRGSAISKHYGYIAQTGELGAGTEWCVVPEKLRVWLNRQIAEPWRNGD